MSAPEIKIDQCLFGYEDGHRLLASSISLGEELAALTELSDLAPGTVFGGSEGYWSGVPAPAIGLYALMRTWPAPEMPRPGCVWTHAMLIEPAALGGLSDIFGLAPLARRPTGLADRVTYRERLVLQPERDLRPAPWTAPPDVALLAGMIEALYGEGDAPVTVIAPGRSDREMFATWSQQWPRLRRNFRFQTAVTRDSRSSSAARLDIGLRLGAPNRPAHPVPTGERWLEAAVRDAKDGGGPLRDFLWRYGTDVRRQRGSFRPLVSIATLDPTAPGAGTELLALVTQAFPDQNDAATLKQDLVDGVVAPAAQLDALQHVLASRRDAVLPQPTEAGVARLTQLWSVRPDDLMRMAESTADSTEPLGQAVYEAITGAAPLADFWRLAPPYPRVWQKMVATRPELLRSVDLATLESGAAMALVALVPVGSRIAGELVSRLLAHDDDALIETLIERFPLEVASEVIAAADGGSVEVGRAWITGLARRPEAILDPSVMGRITRTSLLYELAEALGWLGPEVVAAGTEPWLAALVDIKSDLDDERRDILQSFLVALALATGGGGGRRVLERFFTAVHNQILKSRLPWQAKDILSPLLPEVLWGWDFGLRLRLAVSFAYVFYGYPPASFAILARGKKARAMMADAARAVQGGKPLVQAIEG